MFEYWRNIHFYLIRNDGRLNFMETFGIFRSKKTLEEISILGSQFKISSLLVLKAPVLPQRTINQ